MESARTLGEDEIRAVLALFTDDVDAAYLDFEPQDVHGSDDEEEWPR